MQAAQVRWIPMEEIVEEAAGANIGEVVRLRRRDEGGYVLLHGGRRLNALRLTGQMCVDAVIDPDLDQRIDQLLEQLARGSLHYLDEAEAYQGLLPFCSVSELAERLGRTPTTIRRKMKLNSLGENVRELLRRNALREGYAQQVLRVPGHQGQQRILQHILNGGLSLKESEKLIDDVLSRMPVPLQGGRMKPLMRDYRLYVNAIRDIVEQMCDAGLESCMEVKVGKYMAEVRITVPVFARR